VATDALVYVNPSALAKLVVQEPETQALCRYLRDRRLATSELAIVEVSRVERLAEPAHGARATARGVLAEVDLVAPTRLVLDRALQLTSRGVRSLDAIHLATALGVDPDELVAYDRRLLEAAEAAGLQTASPR
jgi:predicted nucleic acid-binding protein